MLEQSSVDNNGCRSAILWYRIITRLKRLKENHLRPDEELAGICERTSGSNLSTQTFYQNHLYNVHRPSVIQETVKGRHTFEAAGHKKSVDHVVVLNRCSVTHSTKQASSAPLVVHNKTLDGSANQQTHTKHALCECFIAYTQYYTMSKDIAVHVLI